jgi:hypothetical protein
MSSIGKGTDVTVHPQTIAAFIAQLVVTGVEPQQVEHAVLKTLDLDVGQSLSDGDPLVRAFANEQATVLEQFGR